MSVYSFRELLFSRLGVVGGGGLVDRAAVDRGRLVGVGVPGLSGVGHIGHVAVVPVHHVGHGLQPAIREGHAVAALGAVPVPALVLLELGAAVVIRHGVGVAVHGGLAVVRLGIGGGGAIGWADNSAMSGGGQTGEGKEGLEM